MNCIIVAFFNKQVQTMESLKKSHEEYRTHCHIQSVKMSEMETLLLHRNGELEHKQQDLCNSEERSRNLICQMKILKKEKEEMEELLSCRGRFLYHLIKM